MKKQLFASFFCIIFGGNAHSALIGSWNFNENTGTTVHDSSGNGNDGTFQSGTDNWVSGIKGSALEFTGNPSGGVVIPSNATLDLTDQFTISAWVNPANNNGPEVVVSKYENPNPMDFSLKTSASGNKPGFWEFDATQANIWSQTPIKPHQWQNLAITYDGSYMKMYINGYLDAQAKATGNLYFNNDHALVIGGQNGAINDHAPFQGAIDEVNIYNNALSSDQIAQDFKLNAAPEPDGRVLVLVGALFMFLGFKFRGDVRAS